MLVHNITTKVDHAIEQDWLRWQKDEFIPRVMSTGLFFEQKFFRLLLQDETDGKTYVNQFFAADSKDYDLYQRDHSFLFRSAAREKWGDNFISFESLLQTVQ